MRPMTATVVLPLARPISGLRPSSRRGTGCDSPLSKRAGLIFVLGDHRLDLLLLLLFWLAGDVVLARRFPPSILVIGK